MALGFGAQTLVRDMIAGVFIIVEDQFGVGDLIEVDGKAATVEELTVRRTTLRDFNGYLHFVPNGEMKIVVNRSRGWNRVAVDVPIAADQDVDRALEVCRRVADAMNAEPEWRERLLDDDRGVGGRGAGPARMRRSALVVRAVPARTRTRRPASCAGACTGVRRGRRPRHAAQPRDRPDAGRARASLVRPLTPRSD